MSVANNSIPNSYEKWQDILWQLWKNQPIRHLGKFSLSSYCGFNQTNSDVMRLCSPDIHVKGVETSHQISATCHHIFHRFWNCFPFNWAVLWKVMECDGIPEIIRLTYTHFIDALYQYTSAHLCIWCIIDLSDRLVKSFVNSEKRKKKFFLKEFWLA